MFLQKGGLPSRIPREMAFIWVKPTQEQAVGCRLSCISALRDGNGKGSFNSGMPHAHTSLGFGLLICN